MKYNLLKISFIITIVSLFNMVWAEVNVATSSPAVIAPYSKTVAQAKATASYSSMISGQNFLGIHTGANGLRYEIVKVNTFGRGVEIFARAWLNGKQLGLGFDGTTDMERFQIHEPTGLISDPQGTIIQSLYEPTARYTYNPLVNLLNDLEHAILLTGKTNTKIVAGSIGHTTSTYYSQTGGGGGNTTTDGSLVVESTVSWQTAHDATTADSVAVSGVQDYVLSRNISSPYTIYRHIYTFDTSDIGSDSISSSTLSLTCISSGSPNSASIDVVSSNPTNANNLQTSDYATLGTTAFGSLAIASFNTNGSTYNDITLTDTSGITKNGITKLGARVSTDRLNSAPPSSTQDYVNCHFADNGSGQPKLVVVHTAGDPPASGTFPFTPTFNFGLAVNATTTPIWFRAGLMSSSTNPIRIQNTTDAVANQVASFYANARTTPANNDQGYLSFYGNATGAGQQEFSRILWEMSNVGNTTKSSSLKFYNQVNNVLTEGMSLAGTNLKMSSTGSFGTALISANDLGGDQNLTLRSGTTTGAIKFQGWNGSDWSDRITMLNNGNVGIGTTSPSAKIDINGDVKISGNLISDGDICIGTCQ